MEVVWRGEVFWNAKIRYQYVIEPGLLACELKTTLSATSSPIYLFGQGDYSGLGWVISLLSS